MRNVLLMTTNGETEEMLSLLETLGIKSVKTVLQKRSQPHKVGFLGPGKLAEVGEELKRDDFDAIIVNGELRPSQHHYLEMRFQKECLDRAGVILRIFAEHAHTPEAIAQVTLAKLCYEQPFLREWIHKAKKGDRPGFLAGGAYATDVYYEHARSHVKRIEEKLKQISRQREILRSRRHARGYALVSLAGYTNAGKSALFNKISGAHVVVDDQFFSTLSTTTRKLIGVRGNVLVADTVGFIRDLPPDLIDAFNSTLEEIFNADLILLVLDSSEPVEKIAMKLKTSMDILLPRMRDQSLIIVANKIDLLSADRLTSVRDQLQRLAHPYRLVLVSAESGAGLDELRRAIMAVQLRSALIEAAAPISNQSYSLVSRLRATCEVVEQLVSDRLRLTIRCTPNESDKIIGWIRKVGGEAAQVEHEGTSAERESPQGRSMRSEGAPPEQ